MSNIPGMPGVACNNPSGVLPPTLKDPDEFDPIELLRLCQYNFDVSTQQFARWFGCELDTVYKWAQGKKSCKLAKIRAATLKREIGF
jgi:hypothetical protein